jgi:hypothetical protein
MPVTLLRPRFPGDPDEVIARIAIGLSRRAFELGVASPYGSDVAIPSARAGAGRGFQISVRDSRFPHHVGAIPVFRRRLRFVAFAGFQKNERRIGTHAGRLCRNVGFELRALLELRNRAVPIAPMIFGQPLCKNPDAIPRAWVDGLLETNDFMNRQGAARPVITILPSERNTTPFPLPRTQGCTDDGTLPALLHQGWLQPAPHYR